MTPKGAAVLPRPFCCHFAFCRGCFSEPFFAFLPRPFCRHFFYFGAAVLPRPFCRPLFTVFLPRSPSSCSPCPATCCQLFADFRRRRRQLFVNFYPRPLRKSWLFVNFLRHFAHRRRVFCHLLFPFLPYFRFFANVSFFSAKTAAAFRFKKMDRRRRSTAPLSPSEYKKSGATAPPCTRR